MRDQRLTARLLAVSVTVLAMSGHVAGEGRLEDPAALSGERVRTSTGSGPHR
jgi:hypothetical protein